jgi:hypothetical protein
MGTVDLPVQPPIEPMLAKAQTKVPDLMTGELAREVFEQAAA